MQFQVFRPNPNVANGWQALASTWYREDAEAVLANHEAGYITSAGDIITRKNVAL